MDEPCGREGFTRDPADRCARWTVLPEPPSDANVPPVLAPTIDGRVVLVRGTQASVLAPGADAFTLAGTLPEPIPGAAVVSLPDGRLLLAGGVEPGTSEPTTAVGWFDPGTGSFAVAPPLLAPRRVPTAVALGDGRVLVTSNQEGAQAAEVYDPVTASWQATGPTGLRGAPWEGEPLVALPDGRALLLDEENGWSLLDPTTLTWSPAASSPLATWDTKATALPDGRVLATTNDRSAGYDSRTDTWSAVSPYSLPGERGFRTLVGLADGRVLMIGRPVGGRDTLVELFDSSTGVWSPTLPTQCEHTSGQGALLGDGSVVFVSLEPGCGAERFELEE